MRVELGYVKRGARETFSNGGLVINSLSELNYIQGSFLPAIGKFGYRNVGIFIGAGGYAALLTGGKTKYSYFNGKTINNSLPEDSFNKSVWSYFRRRYFL